MSITKYGIHSSIPTRATPCTMAAKSKARTLIIRLISTAQTGYFYTTQRVRTGPKLSVVKYDPIAKARVLFVESRKTRK